MDESLSFCRSVIDYDSIAYINEVLPDESYLKQLPALIKKQNDIITQNEKILRERIRIRSFIEKKGESILIDARKSISELDERIKGIKENARDTEDVIKRISEDILPLDNAKKNLVATVTTLRRLEMLITTIQYLESNIEKRDFGECSANIMAISSLLGHFNEIGASEVVSPFANKFQNMKKTLKSIVNNELDQNLFRGISSDYNLSLCTLIDSFADGFREITIDWFCNKFLQLYDDSFKNSDLSSAHSRYTWFKQRIDYYNQNFCKVFPTEWKMPYWITRAFCQKTMLHLKKILSSQKPDLKQYLSSFEMTIKFESKMADSFATLERTPFDSNSKMPDFPSTAEGVKQKYEYLRRQELGLGEIRKVPASEFIGSIAVAFAPYMQLYLESEKSNFSAIISEAHSNAKNDIDNEEKVLQSSRVLIMAMRKAIEKCAGFGVDQTIIDLFFLLKSLLSEYIDGLTRCLPKKATSDEHYKLICSITNTTALFLSAYDSLESKVQQLLPAEKKALISINDTKEHTGSELRKQIIFLIEVFIKENEASLISIGNGSWIDENGKLPAKLLLSFDNRFSIVGEWLNNDNMNRFRPTFTQKMVTIIRDSLFRSKNINIGSASRILLALKEIKEMVVISTRADSSSSKKRIDFDFSRLESDLTVLCSPEIAMVSTYLGKIQARNKDQFLSLVRLKGLSAQMEMQISNEYDRQLPLFCDK